MMGYSENPFNSNNSCKALTSIDTTGWDTNNVTNMSYMFYGCRALTNLDVSKWNTSNVNDMSYMFAHCKSLPEETLLDIFNKWDTSNVTDMSGMFWNGPRCLSTSASLLSNLSNWDTSNVTNMAAMFQKCESLKTLDISNWDTSNVTNMSGMFYLTEDNDVPEYGAALTTIKGVIDMKSCTEYDQMFWGCPNLTGVKIKNPPAGFRLDISKDQYEIVS